MFWLCSKLRAIKKSLALLHHLAVYATPDEDRVLYAMRCTNHIIVANDGDVVSCLCKWLAPSDCVLWTVTRGVVRVGDARQCNSAQMDLLPDVNVQANAWSQQVEERDFLGHRLQCVAAMVSAWEGCGDFGTPLFATNHDRQVRKVNIQTWCQYFGKYLKHVGLRNVTLQGFFKWKSERHAEGLLTAVSLADVQQNLFVAGLKVLLYPLSLDSKHVCPPSVLKQWAHFCGCVEADEHTLARVSAELSTPSCRAGQMSTLQQ